MKSFLLPLMTILMVACVPDAPETAAPVGDYGALEKLAKSYETISQQFDANPRQLPPSERKRFVEFVFRDAGFGYTATLEHMAKTELDPANNLHRDLMELLFFPHLAGPADMDIYNHDERRYIQIIQQTMG